MTQDTRFVNGAERLAQRIRTIRNKLGLPPLTDEIGDLLLSRTLRRFDQEVDPDGNAWEALSPVTIQIKLRLGYPLRKLVRTRTMRDSIQKIRGAAAGATFSNTGAGVRIGIPAGKTADVARIQNYGNSKIPARRFLGVGRLDVKAVDSFLRRRAQQVIDES